MEENKLTDPDKPPFFKSWRTMYWIVMSALVIQILVYYGITKYFE